MYIEVFLLDNLLMDALILRLACALCARPCIFFRIMICAIPGVLYAWFSTQWEFLQLWHFKLLCGAAMAFALPNGGRLRAYLAAWVSVMLSAAILGGMVFMLSFTCGMNGAAGELHANYHVALWGICLAAFIPNAVRRRRVPLKRYDMRVACMGNVYSVPACIDTGNILRESVSGKPVIVAYIPELQNRANIPVPMTTVRETGVLYALRADMITLDGVPTDALLAICPEKLENALVPPCAISIL